MARVGVVARRENSETATRFNQHSASFTHKARLMRPEIAALHSEIDSFWMQQSRRD